MKFIVNSDSSDFLVCDSCGSEDFDLSPDKKVFTEGPQQFFIFYECPNCAGAGFWAHASSIDEKRQVGIALSRCKASSAATSEESAASPKRFQTA